MHKRILTVLGALAVLCGSIFVVPASAAQQIVPWDWEDYITSESFSDDKKIVTVVVPINDGFSYTSPCLTWGGWMAISAGGGNFQGVSVDENNRAWQAALPLSNGITSATYYLSCYLFGQPYSYSSYCGLKADNIPNGATLNWSFNISGEGGGNVIDQVEETKLTVSYKTWDATNGWKTLSSITEPVGYFFESSTDVSIDKDLGFSFTVDKPEGTQYIDITIYMGAFSLDVGSSEGYLRFAPSPLALTMETAAIKEVLDRLDSINDAINKPASPVAPSGSGQVDDYHDQEDQLMQGVSGGQSQVGNVQNNAAAGLTTYASGFAFMAATVNYFVDGVPFISDIIWIALSLGTVAALLGIVPSIFRDRGDHSERPPRSSSKKE